MDELAIPLLGPERARWQYPFRSLGASGATLAAGRLAATRREGRAGGPSVN